MENDLLPANLVDSCKQIVKGQVIIGNTKQLSSIVRIVHNKDYAPLMIELSNMSGIPADINNKYSPNQYNLDNLNLLRKCVFVVSNLDRFKQIVGDSVGIKVNHGSQSLRGEFNSLDHYLGVLDKEFR